MDEIFHIIVSLTKSKIKLKIYFVKFLVAFLENLNFKKKPLFTAWTREISPSGELTTYTVKSRAVDRSTIQF